MREKSRELKKEFLKTLIQLATAGFGLTAALAWNTAIQNIIKRVLPADGSDVTSQVIYAIIVTAIAVLVTYSLSKMLQNEENESDKKKK